MSNFHCKEIQSRVVLIEKVLSEVMSSNINIDATVESKLQL